MINRYRVSAVRALYTDLMPFPMSSVAPPSEFHQLQACLRDRWQHIDHAETDEADILVIPSLSMDQRELQKIQGFLHYEERMLFSLIRLRNPRTRLIYVTSQPLPAMVIDYYLQLLPGIPFSHARDRLLLFPLHDQSPKPLTQKILERPRLLARIRHALRPELAYMVCYNSSSLEQQLSVRLGIPLLAADPALLDWGTKSGSRKIFAECGILHPDGSPLIHDPEALVDEAADLWARNPTVQRLVVKLNEGFSGEGNAILDLRDCESGNTLNRDRRRDLIRDRLPRLAFESATESWPHFATQITTLGAIVEVFIEGQEKRWSPTGLRPSPSVQGRITPTGQVEILSTHDQILGGPNQQIYLGCRFPADPAYRLILQRHGERVGQNLAQKGVLERFGVDFVVVPSADPAEPWQAYAIEINLRKGGTTHPFMTLKLLTNGQYDRQTGAFKSLQGSPKYYVATDNLQQDSYRGLLPCDLMDIIADHHLHFDSGSETGTVFHLMGALSEFGKLGLTSIGNSPDHADAIYQQVVAVLNQETQGKRCAIATETHAMPPIGWSR
jgi:hypothetical protein